MLSLEHNQSCLRGCPRNPTLSWTLYDIPVFSECTVVMPHSSLVCFEAFFKTSFDKSVFEPKGASRKSVLCIE